MCELQDTGLSGCVFLCERVYCKLVKQRIREKGVFACFELGVFVKLIICKSAHWLNLADAIGRHSGKQPMRKQGRRRRQAHRVLSVMLGTPNSPTCVCVLVESMALADADYWQACCTGWKIFFYFSCLLPHFQISSQKPLQNKDNSTNIFSHCALSNTLLQIQMQFYTSTVVLN